jgi:uncharacterized protein YuzE
MKIFYDSGTDTLNLVFSDTGVITKELGEGIAAERDEDGKLTRVMVREVSKSTAAKEVFRQIVIEGIGPFVESEPLIIVPRLFAGSEMLD